VPMAPAGRSGSEFGQSALLECFEVFTDGSIFSLEDLHACGVQPGKRPSTDSANENDIHRFALQRPQGMTGTVFMVFVSIVDDPGFSARQIVQHEAGC